MSVSILRPAQSRAERRAPAALRLSLIHCFVGFAVLSLAATIVYVSEPYLNALFILGFPASFVCLWSATASRLGDLQPRARWTQTFSASAAGLSMGIAVALWLCG